MKIKILKGPYKGIYKRYEEGDIVTIPTDKNGTALDIFWRRAIKDLSIDSAIEIVKEGGKELFPSSIKKQKKVI